MDQEPIGTRGAGDDPRAAPRPATPLSAGLLANLSHELRTPLNAILGWAQVLDRGGVDDTVLRRAADAIARNVRAQSALVDELLDLSRLDAGTLRLDAGDCDVAVLLGETADALAQAARARWIEIDLGGVAATGGLHCRGEAARLKQAVRHVLDNAVKHALLNGRVRVAAAREGALLRIAVADDGDGIAPADLPHVFDGLHRADAAPRPGGLGIGLALTRGLIELHGGHVAVESAGPGRGTTVRIELPATDGAAAKPGATTGLPAAAQGGAAEAATTGTAAAPALAWRRILLLEDDVDTLEVTSLLLREHGAIVHAFDNAELALAAAENGSFDLVVSDLGMPGMNGLEFMSRLRAAAGEVPAIALTAYAGDEPRRLALAAGFRRVETKPIEAQRLLAAVKAELARGPSP